MIKPVILFADNDPDFLHTRSEFLKEEGYTVILAANPVEARRKLETNPIDLAIIDVRLEDDDDEKDDSGLILAREVAPSAPKIILTNFPNVNNVKEALRPLKDGLPPAVDFIDKKEGPEALLRSIRNALSRKVLVLSADEIKKKLQPVTFDISAQLSADFDEVRKSALNTDRIWLWSTVMGFGIICIGCLSVVIGKNPAGVVTAISGTIVSSLAALFRHYKRDAFRRKDQYHKELIIILYKDDKEFLNTFLKEKDR